MMFRMSPNGQVCCLYRIGQDKTVYRSIDGIRVGIFFSHSPADQGERYATILSYFSKPIGVMVLASWKLRASEESEPLSLCRFNYSCSSVICILFAPTGYSSPTPSLCAEPNVFLIIIIIVSPDHNTNGYGYARRVQVDVLTNEQTGIINTLPSYSLT